MAIGPIMLFFGKRFIPWFIGIFGGFITFLVVILLCSIMGLLNYLDPNSQDKTGGAGTIMVVSFLLALFSGVLVGWLLKRYLMVGLCILAGGAGFMLGLMVYNLIFVAFIKSNIFLAAITLLPGFYGAYLAYKHGDTIVILVTAMIGSYLTIRGLSMFFGGFPNEIALFQEIANGTASYKGWFIAYLVAIGILFVLGVMYQNKNKSKYVDHFQKKDEKKENLL